MPWKAWARCEALKGRDGGRKRYCVAKMDKRHTIYGVSFIQSMSYHILVADEFFFLKHDRMVRSVSAMMPPMPTKEAPVSMMK